MTHKKVSDLCLLQVSEDVISPMTDYIIICCRHLEDWQRFFQTSEDHHTQQSVAKCRAFGAFQDQVAHNGHVNEQWFHLALQVRPDALQRSTFA